MLEWIAETMSARSARKRGEIQSLWSGYGSVFRVALDGAAVPSVVVKRIAPPSDRSHPRGWHTDRGHERKLRSYEVETHWYQRYAARCEEPCRVPRCYGARTDPDGRTLLLEDLDLSGFPERRSDLGPAELARCLVWLAHFHATFIGTKASQLWEVGTYWHLATRPDELAAMPDGPLRGAAAAIDRRLSDARHLTLVHGDAKVANFCFGRNGVAAVDFQYVGGGCGMKDVAYFFSSCLSSQECDAQAERLLDLYFDQLRTALGPDFEDPDALEAEWRSLYPFAWADFTRFLEGWSPGHWKLGPYADRMTKLALADL